MAAMANDDLVHKTTTPDALADVQKPPMVSEKSEKPASGNVAHPRRHPKRSRTQASQAPNAKKSFKERIMGLIPASFMKIKERRQQKLFFRCWLGSWICMIFLLPNKNLRVMGNAAFFAAIASTLIPANMPVQTFLLAMVTLVAGCSLGWAWGCAAMAAAYHARDQGLYQRTLRSVAGTYGTSRLAIQTRVFHGDFLDTHSTVIYGVFLGVGTFITGYIRAANAKLAIPMIFCTIFMDVICSYGPLLPTPQYTILNTFVISTAYYIAVGLFLILFIFPQSLNHEWIGDVNKLLSSVEELIKAQDEVLEVDVDALTKEEGSLFMKLRGKGDAVVASLQALAAKTPMLKMEFSYGQLSAADLESLELPLKNLVMRARGLLAFLTLLVAHSEKRRQYDEDPNADHDEHLEETESKDTKPRKATVGDTFRLMHVRRSNAQWEDDHQLRIEEMLPILRTATADLRAATLEGVQVANKALQFSNTNRYKRRFPWAKKVLEESKAEERDVAAALKNLGAAIDEYNATLRLTLLEPYHDLIQSPFEVDQHGRPPFSLRPLFLCFVFQSNLLWTAGALKSVLALLHEAQRKRPESKLWSPTGLSKLWWYLRPDGKTSALDEDLPPLMPTKPEEGDDDYWENEYQKDPDAMKPTKWYQKIGHGIHRFHDWLRTAEVLYAMKFSTLTILLWLPQVLKRSAWFVYTERGLWGLIMAQMTLAVYMSDQLSALGGRLIGTIGGGILGLAAWYIGDGSGQGNPYGFAASSALFLVPIIFLRLYGPNPLEAIMVATTMILILGYSWIDTHNPSLGNPGYGWDVAWRRVVLVLIGSAASLVFMLLPPQSLRHDIRRSNAANLKDISRLFSMLLSNWLGDVDEEQPGPVTRTDTSSSDSSSSSDDHDQPEHKESMKAFWKWGPSFRAHLLEVASRLETLQKQTESAKWEGNIRGRWPHEKYEALLVEQSTMINNLAQLASALGHLGPAWRRQLLHRTAFLNPNLITDVMAVFGIVAMSLDSGEAIHEVLPKSLLDRVYYHYSLAPHLHTANVTPDTSSDHTIHQSHLTLETFTSPEFAFYAAGCSGAYQILNALDELHRTAKSLCGEVPLKGFENWRRQFEMRQMSERV